MAWMPGLTGFWIRCKVSVIKNQFLFMKLYFHEAILNANCLFPKLNVSTKHHFLRVDYIPSPNVQVFCPHIYHCLSDMNVNVV